MGNTDKFDMIADRYDTPERIEIAKVSADAIRGYLVDANGATGATDAIDANVANAANGANAKHAIDFGCGTGLIGLNLLDDFGSMLFLDTSPNMIQRIRQKIAEFHLEHADTLCFDLEQEELPDLRADYIVMAQVLLHIRDVEPVLAKLLAMLNDGGHVMIVDFDKNENVVSEIVHNGFHQAELAGLMARIGYQAIRSETFYAGSRIFMGQDASMFILDARK